MNLANQQLQIQFERAMKVLCEHVSVSTEKRKPQLMHCLRVGIYLFENDYSEDVVIGGLLHDMLEWTNCSEGVIREEFGQRVLDIVRANTKNRDIKDQKKRQEDYVDRCAQVGDEALIVKAADALDSYQYYVAIKRQKEIDRSVAIAKLIIEKGLKDKIVNELKKIV
jgi:(p)ppGpp synthase/HD superfamily hydrolase